MAEDFVRIGQFEEFCRGNDQRFVDLEKKMDQGFAHATKEREHILVHLNQRFDDMLSIVDLRIDGVNQRIDGVNQRFDGVNQRFDGVNQRFDGVNQRFDGLSQRIDDVKDGLDKQLAFQNKFVIGMFLMMLAGLIKFLFFDG